MEALQNNTTREVTPYQPTTDWGAGQNLSFRCMQTALALPIDRVREIIEYGQVTTVPMMPGYVRGVLNLRGNVVPVIDLAFRFGGKPTEVGRRTCIIILELPIGKTSQLAGLIVDAVDDEGATCRTRADAPEIDGNLFIDEEFETLAPGDMVTVRVEEASEYDLWGRIA